MRTNHSMVKSIIFVLLYGFSATQVLHAATATKEELSDGELEIADDEESVATSKKQAETMDKTGAILPKTDVHDFLQQKLGDNWKTLIKNIRPSVLRSELGDLSEEDERWQAILKLRKQAKNRTYQSTSRHRHATKIATLQTENAELRGKMAQMDQAHRTTKEARDKLLQLNAVFSQGLQNAQVTICFLQLQLAAASTQQQQQQQQISTIQPSYEPTH